MKIFNCKRRMLRKEDWRLEPVEPENGGNKKTKQAKFSEKRTFLSLIICTCTYAYPKVRDVRFLENVACLVFLLPSFYDLPFCLNSDNYGSADWVLTGKLNLKEKTPLITLKFSNK